MLTYGIRYLFFSSPLLPILPHHCHHVQYTLKRKCHFDEIFITGSSPWATADIGTVAPSPKDNGRCIDVDEQLVIKWMCGTTALGTALQLLFNMWKRSWEFVVFVVFASTTIWTAQIWAKLQTSSNQSNIRKSFPSANRQDEDEALDGTLPGVVSIYMCQHPLSYT